MDENKKKYQRFKYTQKSLEKALQAISNGQLSLCKASTAFQIPKSTLSNKINQRVPWQRQMGPPPELTHNEEAKLAQWILNKAKLGFPMHPEEVYDTVQDFLNESHRITKFTNNRPGKKWLALFLNRYPEITKRNAEIISKARAAVTEECIRKWFSELNGFLEEENYTDIKNDPSRIFNTDETGVMTCPKTGIILGPRNYKNTYEIATSKEKESITVLCTFAADGNDVPPFVVYPYKRMPSSVINNHPESWLIGRSDSGWMVSETFYAYIKMFYEWLVQQGIKLPVILFLDGHKSHINQKMFEFCQEKGIVLFCLYPNATHILQPCDVAIFKPIKNAWKKVVRKHKQVTTAPINKQNFAQKFKEAYDKGLRPAIVINGFRACGLYPLDPNAVDYSKCINTRRQEILANNNTTCNLTDHQNDLRSTMRVIETEIGDTLRKEFIQCHLNKCVHNHFYFDLWSKCKFRIENQWQINILQRPTTSQDLPMDLSASSKDSTNSQNVDLSADDAQQQARGLSHSIEEQATPSSVCDNDLPQIIEEIAQVQSSKENSLKNSMPIGISQTVHTAASDYSSEVTPRVQTNENIALVDQLLTSFDPVRSPETITFPVIEQMPLLSPVSDTDNDSSINPTTVIVQVHATEAEEANHSPGSSALIDLPSHPSLVFNNSELCGHSTGLDLMRTEEMIEFFLEHDTNEIENIPSTSHDTGEPSLDSYLKYPTIPETRKAIKKKEPMPYGLTGRKYKEYIQKINDEKKRKEEELNKRREEKRKARELRKETMKKKRAEIHKKPKNIHNLAKNATKRNQEYENNNSDQDMNDTEVIQDQYEEENDKNISRKRKLETETIKNSRKVLKPQNVTINSIHQNDQASVVDNNDCYYDDTKSQCGKYVIVRFNTDRRKRYFVGKVLMVNEALKKYKVEFLRKRSVIDNIVNFVKPVVEDIAEVNHGDIERFLSDPTCSRRGLITFADVSFENIE